MTIENERARLRMAVDRQGRAETAEAWHADQSTIDDAVREIRRLGGDGSEELRLAYEAARQADERELEA